MVGSCDGGSNLSCYSEDSSMNSQPGPSSLHWTLEF